MQGICKHEAAQRPCPRIALVCCSALVSSGLHEEGLFQKDAPDDLVHFLLGAFEEGCGAVLPPPGQHHVSITSMTCTTYASHFACGLRRRAPAARAWSAGNN